MAGRMLFIDFENVQKINLARMPMDARVMTFYGVLVRHLQTCGHACRRVRAVEDAFPIRKPAAESDHFSRLLPLLKKETPRTAKLKSLAGKVKSWFPNLPDSDRRELIDRLLKESRVRVSENLREYECLIAAAGIICQSRTATRPLGRHANGARRISPSQSVWKPSKGYESRVS